MTFYELNKNYEFMQMTLLLTFIAVDKWNISIMARRKRQFTGKSIIQSILAGRKHQFKRKSRVRKKRKTKRDRRRKSHSKKNTLRKIVVKAIHAK